MSRACVLNVRKLRKRKMRTPEEARFMTLFGATDLYLNYAGEINRVSADDLGPAPLVGVPLSSPLPVPLALPLSGSLSPERQREAEALVPTRIEGPRPAMTAKTSQQEEPDETPDANALEDLLGFLGEAGLGVSEVKALPSGATRITVKDHLRTKARKSVV